MVTYGDCPGLFHQSNGVRIVLGLVPGSRLQTHRLAETLDREAILGCERDAEEGLRSRQLANVPRALGQLVGLTRVFQGFFKPATM